MTTTGNAVTDSLRDGAYKSLLGAFESAAYCRRAIEADKRGQALQGFADAWSSYGAFSALAARLPKCDRDEVYSTVIDYRDTGRLLALLEECRVLMAL